MLVDVGRKIKELRTGKDMTLKDLSEVTGFSVGFLSQLERGLTTIAIDALARIAEVFDVDLTHFVDQKRKKAKHYLRGFEKEVADYEKGHFVSYLASPDVTGMELFPRMIDIMPTAELSEDVEVYGHEGEEFVYVVEGILTLLIEDERVELYPGDMAHYKSTLPHNWVNLTNRVVKIMTVHTPNFYAPKTSSSH